MNTDIKTFILGINENTGLNVSVYSIEGELLLGDCPIVFNGGQADSDTKVLDGYTVFNFKYKNKDYVGAIKGDGNDQRVLAYLVRELASSAAANDVVLSRAEFCSSVLFGEANFSQIDRYLNKYGMKNSPSCVMVISAPESSVPEVKNVVSNFTVDTSDFLVEVDQNKVAFVKFVADQNADYHSMTEYAEFLQQSIFEETGAPIKIALGGIVKNLEQLNYSFEQALSCAKMVETLGSNVNVHTFKEFIFVKIIEDLPKHKLAEYLELLTDDVAKEIFSDKEMVLTAEEFLENSLNVSETARKLFLHRNTLIYRLDKIEKETGLNIRKFTDAITFRLITILYKMTR